MRHQAEGRGAVRCRKGGLLQSLGRLPAAITARKDDAPAAVQAAIANVAGFGSCSGGGGLIQTTSG